MNSDPRLLFWPCPWTSVYWPERLLYKATMWAGHQHDWGEGFTAEWQEEQLSSCHCEPLRHVCKLLLIKTYKHKGDYANICMATTEGLNPQLLKLSLIAFYVSLPSSHIQFLLWNLHEKFTWIVIYFSMESLMGPGKKWSAELEKSSPLLYNSTLGEVNKRTEKKGEITSVFLSSSSYLDTACYRPFFWAPWSVHFRYLELWKGQAMQEVIFWPCENWLECMIQEMPFHVAPPNSKVSG